MVDRRLTRRRAIAGIGATGIGAVAGCLGILGGGSGAYTRWLADPGVIAGHEEYTFRSYDVATLNETVDSWADQVRLDRSSLVGVDPGQVDHVTQIPLTHAIEGSFDAGAVEDRLSEEGFERVGEYEGYAILDAGNRGRTVGVGDEVVATHRLVPDGPGRIRTLVDAKAGDVDHFPDVDDDCARIVDELGDATVHVGTTEPREVAELAFSGHELAAVGHAWTVSGDTSDVVVAHLYEEPVADEARGLIENWANRDPVLDTHSISTSDRLLRFETSYDGSRRGYFSIPPNY